jgi:hypothetical protein
MILIRFVYLPPLPAPPPDRRLALVYPKNGSNSVATRVAKVVRNRSYMAYRHCDPIAHVLTISQYAACEVT